MNRRIIKTLLTFTIMFTISTSIAFAAPILKINSKGHDVTLLQQRLNAIGYQVNCIDGIFGEDLKATVILFQKDNGLEPTGVVDSNTWNSIKNPKKKISSNTASANTTIKNTISTNNTTTAKPVTSVTTAITANNPTKAMSLPVSKGTLFLDRSKVSNILNSAKKLIGVRYQWGGTTPSGFDCSGFLMYVFKQNGYPIPRLADEQYAKLGKSATIPQLEPGDLVFFDVDGIGEVTHCGIYVGSRQFIHASSSKGIRIDSLDNSYWQPRYYGGKHIVK